VAPKSKEEGNQLVKADLKKRVYDASAISTYLSCPQKFYWRYVRNLVPVVEPPALVFGRVMHEALLVWYKTKDIIEAVKVFEQLPKDIGNGRRTRERGEVILKEYVKRYFEEPYQIRQMEIKFCVGMEEGRMYVGKIDQIVEWEKNIFVKDHKTTSALGLSFYRSFRPSVQIDGYVYACRELCGQCSGAIINGISVADNPKERFGRDISNRTSDEIDKFAVMFAKWCEQIEISLLKQDFYLNYNSCNNMGRCIYYELCLYGESKLITFKEDEAEKNENGRMGEIE